MAPSLKLGMIPSRTNAVERIFLVEL